MNINESTIKNTILLHNVKNKIKVLFVYYASFADK
jgi:hypothetical protein